MSENIRRNAIMNLRKLKEADAPLMLEWMHNNIIVKDMRANFAGMTISDCNRFIKQAQLMSNNIHLAIVDHDDIYMGTVSLKHINRESAELGITVRSCAMGKGYSQFAVEQIMKIAFEQMNLKRVYWCVSPLNERALKFYDKNDYPRVIMNALEIHGGYTEEEIREYVWYQVVNNQDKI